MAKTQTLGPGEIQAALDRLAAAISARHASTEKLLLLGIANGGIELARRLSARLSALDSRLSTLAGTLDISFHRDDIGGNPIPKEFAPTHIPADVNGATVILVDDVLFSGRTAKAALDELFDHGRPAKVELAVLADRGGRGGRRLPIAADYTGLTLSAGDDEKVVVRLDPANPARDAIRVEAAASFRKPKVKN
ncbi:MAG TPA: bifunctional pyr operon transcriptional regulator/uracil phosphoribosyltransferase PyrR [Opitutaceae bacterium]|nr:bifunctional pyr operon transcriptional regulator/uracil phosphoribosyltransferase PyrR [Opitutaceae bacterium]